MSTGGGTTSTSTSTIIIDRIGERAQEPTRVTVDGLTVENTRLSELIAAHRFTSSVKSQGRLRCRYYQQFRPGGAYGA